MRIDVERSDLSAILSAVSKVVEARNTYPILANVLLTATSDRLSARGTDLDIEISTSCPAKGEPGTTTVPAKTLAEIVKKLPAGAAVRLELDGETLTIKSGRSEFKLQTISPDSFPTLSAGAFSAEFTANLSALFEPVKFAISNEETRYYLNGIYLHAPNGSLRAVATDGHRMARMDGPETDAEFVGVIVPTKTIRVIPNGEIKVELSTTKIRLTAGNLVVVSKLIEGTFPDYERVTPKNNGKIAVLDRVMLSAAVDRVSTIASDRGGRAVKVGFASDAVSLEVSNPDHGTATEEMSGTYSAEPLDIGFNAKYLADVLGAIGGTLVQIELNDAGSPTILKGDGSLLCVLMPMRV